MLAGALLTGVCFAQSSTESQTSGSASQSGSVSADKSSMQAGSQTSANASEQAAASKKAGSQSSEATASNQLAAASTVHATLAKPVDARKSKPGDAVVAKTTEDMKSEGHVVIPKGSKILGHVTEVKARAKGQSESAIGIAFDRAMLKDGHEMPFTATIQAIAASEANASAAAMGDDVMAGGSGTASGQAGSRAGGGMVNGAVRPVGAAAGTLVNTAGSAANNAGATVNGAASSTLGTSSRLSASSHGAIGLQGLSLNAQAANSTQGSVISSNSQNVHLDSGTQLILRVNSQ